jgi:broad specificity phosphatase PhoE
MSKPYSSRVWGPWPRRIVLVRHARPEVLSGHPPHEWPLSDQGIQDAVSIAAVLRAYEFTTVASSPEPKALQTAQKIASALVIPVAIEPGLAEHRRDDDAYLDPENFERQIEKFFSTPEEVVFGVESAAEALDRFRRGLNGMPIASADVLAVTHARVISLYAASVTGTPAIEIWRQLRLPDVLELSGAKMTFL